MASVIIVSMFSACKGIQDPEFKTVNNLRVTKMTKKAVIVEGEANVTYKGNLNLNVTGDFNVNCRDYNVHARGSKTEQIDNNSSTSVFGNYGNSVSGTFVQSVAGNTTNLTLGTQTLVTKGNMVVATEGSQEK